MLRYLRDVECAVPATATALTDGPIKGDIRPEFWSIALDSFITFRFG